MANIQSAKKRIRVIEKKTARNNRIRGHVKEADKAFLAAVASGNKEEATKAFIQAEKRHMKAAATSVSHKNNAARTISRFAAKLNSMSENLEQ